MIYRIQDKSQKSDLEKNIHLFLASTDLEQFTFFHCIGKYVDYSFVTTILCNVINILSMTHLTTHGTEGKVTILLLQKHCSLDSKSVTGKQ